MEMIELKRCVARVQGSFIVIEGDACTFRPISDVSVLEETFFSFFFHFTQPPIFHAFPSWRQGKNLK